MLTAIVAVMCVFGGVVFVLGLVGNHRYNEYLRDRSKR